MPSAIGHVDFSFTACLRPWGRDPEQYWTEVTGRIAAIPDEAPDDAEAEPAGEIQMVLVRVAEARNDRVSLATVFDSHSEALLEIYHALFDKSEEVEAELGLDPWAHEVLWVHTIKMEPRWKNSHLAAQAIHTAASTLVTMGLIVADADLGLPMDDWLKLGFVRIAGQPWFYVRERTKKNPYRRQRPRR